MIRYSQKGINKVLSLSKRKLNLHNQQSLKATQASIFLTSFTNSTLNKKLIFTYLTPVDKPIQSVSLNSIIELGAETMYYPFLQWSVPSQFSIILGGIAFRILIQFCSKLFQDMRLSNSKNRTISKIIQKVFIVDLNRDIKFYEFDHRKAYLMHKYYNASYIVKNLVTFYLNLNFLRSCNYILTNQQYFSFHLHTSFIPTLSSHDPKFLLPLLPMFLTYFWISGSRHPLLIHLNRPQNLFYRINLAFMTGLVCVPLPAIYTLSYTGLLCGHLLIRSTYHEASDLRQEWRDMLGQNKKFIEQKQKQIKEQKQLKIREVQNQVKKDLQD